MGEIVIGGFYDTGNEIVYTYRWSGASAIIGAFNYQGNILEFHSETTKDWKRLPIIEFPETWNPRLPYDFDLFWDIKTCNDLWNYTQEQYLDTVSSEVASVITFKDSLKYVEDQELLDLIEETLIYDIPLKDLMLEFEMVKNWEGEPPKVNYKK